MSMGLWPVLNKESDKLRVSRMLYISEKDQKAECAHAPL